MGINITNNAVLAPNHRWRWFVTPVERGKGVKRIVNTDVRSSAERNVAMSWARGLKRVFKVDIEACRHYGGSVKSIACTEDRDIIDRTLAHLRENEQNPPDPPVTHATPEGTA